MFSIQQLIKSTRKLQASSVGSADLAKNLKNAAVVGNHYSHNQHHHHYQHQQQQTNHYEQTHLEIGSGAVAMTPAVSAPDMTSKILLSTPSPSSSSSLSLSPLKTPTSSSSSSLPSSLSASPSPRQRQTNVTSQPQQQQQSHEEQLNSNEAIAIERSSNRKTTTMTSDNSSSGKYGSCDELSQCSDLKENSSSKQTPIKIVINTQEHKFTTTTNTIASNSAVTTNNSDNNNAFAAAKISRITSPHLCNRSQKSFYQQQLQQLHTQANQSLWAKQKQTHFTMSSLAAAEPLSALKNTDDLATAAAAATAAASATAAAATTSNSTNGENGVAENSSKSMTANKGKTCFKSGCSEILQFMELIGNLKHTKRTGWVLRDVNDCESISGHMYRMSMMTFLLDGTEGLNPIRCMELALVHDLAESIVGDLTPFCGISKEEKRNKEFKAMDDICKLIEPRGKRIMELFVEYETGESAESKFVKDLDRLDMVMQAFEYEKRDNCLLKHQEFFDSTEGKFKHPFVQQLVKEIYAQRVALAKDKGATPPPNIVVPDWEHPAAAAPTQTPNGNQSNGHCCQQQSSGAASELPPEQNSSKTSTS